MLATPIEDRLSIRCEGIVHPGKQAGDALLRSGRRRSVVGLISLCRLSFHGDQARQLGHVTRVSYEPTSL